MQRILVFRTGQLGDSLVVLPALHALREANPDAEFVLLYDQHMGKKYVLSKSLFEGAGFFGDFIEYPVGYSTKTKLYALFFQLILLFRLRQQRFDSVVHLEPELKTHSRLLRDKFFFRMAGIRKQITTLQFRNVRSVRKPLQLLEHESDFFLRALGAQGLKVPSVGTGSMELGLGRAEDFEYYAWLSSIRLKQLPKRSIGVGVGSKMQSKLWPKERYLAVLLRLIETYQVEPVFFGGPSDTVIADELIRQLGSGLNACGELSLRGSARALQDCLFYLGNDTGTMHLAVAAGLKCVAIFSARDVPGKWYPYGVGHEVHRVAVDCEGCLLYECHEEGRKCLLVVTVEEVYESCLKLIKSNFR